MKHLSTIILILALLAVPAAAALEHTDAKLWTSRLFIPSIEPEEPDRHTPVFALGTFLPPIIKTDLTLSPADNPVILTGTTTVAPDVTLSLNPGTHIYTHEFSELHIDGTLQSTGDSDQPVIFTTNEKHPDNQLWNGIIIEPAGRADISYTSIEYGTPAITCERGSRAAIENTAFNFNNLALFTQSSTCTLTNSLIQLGRDGVISIGLEPVIQNTQINVTRKPIQTFNIVAPNS